MKKVLSIFIVAIVLFSGISASAAMVNGTVELYQNQFEESIGWLYADYLVDFDGDGIDEHLVITQDYSDDEGKFSFTVWAGANKLVESTYYDSTGYDDNFIEGIICQKNDGSNRKYLMLKGSIYQTDDYVFYTVVNGKWTQTDKWHTEYARGENFDLYVNGVAMYSDDFYAMVNEYIPHYYLNERGGNLVLNSAQIEIGRQKYMSDWAKQEIFAAEDAGIIPSSLASPEYRTVITRQQFATLVASLVEKSTGETLAVAPTDTFSDCKDTAVLKAYNAGIVNGVSETEFSPEGVLSREQLATMLWRAILYIQDETEKAAFKEGGSLAGFTDANTVSDWAKEAVAALNSNGIMKGTSEKEISPLNLCSVEQSIVLAYRTYESISGFKKSDIDQSSINSAYVRADLYDGRESVALIVDWPKEWKDIIGVSETFENDSYEELMVVPMENNSLVEIYSTDYREIGGEYGFVKEECLYSKYSYDGYALLVRSMQYENIPYAMIVVTSPDGRTAEYTMRYCRRERYYDFERFYYISD